MERCEPDDVCLALPGGGRPTQLPEDVDIAVELREKGVVPRLQARGRLQSVELPHAFRDDGDDRAEVAGRIQRTRGTALDLRDRVCLLRAELRRARRQLVAGEAGRSASARCERKD